MSEMVPVISPFLWNAFGRYAEWYVPRHFHGVRLLAEGKPPTVVGRPLVVYLNHPSWWDPMICLLLARRFWPERKHYAPIAAAGLRRYRFFERLGFFGVEPSGTAGGIAFLRTARDVLRQNGSTLWVTAQGEFVDPRRRPLRLRPGLGHLLRHLDGATVVPLALEYAFWGERSPEALAAFGEPLEITGQESRGATEWTSLLERRLLKTSDDLAMAAMSRDPVRFVSLRDGAAGVGVAYDLWSRGKAWMTGRRWRSEHGAGLR